ncbi:MAG: methionyl-tRNA formyltransferase [Candidatus Pacebacteria bacterium]|nr:methionyl-tRNA formyltransferase [Candidatus Paceibacterota bacterium]
MNITKKSNSIKTNGDLQTPTSNGMNIAFFGSPELAVTVLEELKEKNIVPSLIVTQPNKKVGRKLIVTPPPVKTWADKNSILTQQPEKLDEEFISKLKLEKWDLFILVAYGKIISQEILDIPVKGILNLHPSLLPKYRGATPIHSPILNGDTETGVSIVLLDNKLDHGPILAQEKITLWENSISEMPIESDLEKTLAQLGGKLLGETISKWLNNEIIPQEQNHEEASFCNKFKSENALIDLKNNSQENFLKIQAFNKWPKAHYFGRDNKRVIIKKAHLKDDKLIIDRVTHEGGQEIDFK